MTFFRKTIAVPAFFILLLILFNASCTRPPAFSHYQGATMGTSYSVKVAGEYQAKVAQDLQRLLDDVDAKMSTYKPSSELSRFNNMGEGCMAMSADTLRVVKAAQELYQKSNAAFDPSVGALVDLWGFGAKGHEDKVPAEDLINAAKAQLGFDLVSIQKQQLCKARANIRIDLSAIAKGYAVDVLADYLHKKAYRHFLVEVGGELYAKGSKTHKQPWRIGIETPTAGKQNAFEHRALKLLDIGVATSGDYRNYFEKNGVRYSHTINPSTGMPIRHQLASVTVLDATTMRADGWATALMVLGEVRGLQLANQYKIAALFIYKSEHGFASVASDEFHRLYGAF